MLSYKYPSSVPLATCFLKRAVLRTRTEAVSKKVARSQKETERMQKETETSQKEMETSQKETERMQKETETSQKEIRKKQNQVLAAGQVEKFSAEKQEAIRKDKTKFKKGLLAPPITFYI